MLHSSKHTLGKIL